MEIPFDNYGVHEKQALLLVNYGSASVSYILELANTIKANVLTNFKILLDIEVNIF